jgi:hypothetical protein
MNLTCCSASGGGCEERRGLTLEIAAAAKQDLSELRPEPVAGAGFGGGGHFTPPEHSARASGAAGTAIGLLGTGAAAKLLVAHAHQVPTPPRGKGHVRAGRGLHRDEAARGPQGSERQRGDREHARHDPPLRRQQQR